MLNPPVYIVHLRRPNRSNPNEMRSDPFWEFGSFGCTGCHSKNLLHPRNAEKLKGARLAFAQGGREGFRLVLLTPEVSIQNLGARFEVRWKPARPFKYPSAPVLVANDGRSDMPLLRKFVSVAKRETLEGSFSSCFRTRCRPLERNIANQIIKVSEAARKRPSAQFAECYSEALPYPPPTIDMDRKTSYFKLLERLGGSTRPKRTANTCANRNSKARNWLRARKHRDC